MKTQHLIIDAQMVGRGGDYILADEERMFDFLMACMQELNMRILNGPEISRGHIDLPGVSGFVMIETSHIACHTFTRTGDIRFDVYSCVPFFADSVLKLFRQFYPVDHLDYQSIDRKPVITGDYRAMRKEET